MKFIRKHKNSINESRFFKTPEEIKARLDAKKELSDEESSKEFAKKATSAILNPRLPLIEKTLVDVFVNPAWWADTALGDSTNLRPGSEEPIHFNQYCDNITGKSYDQQLQYLKDKVPYKISAENGKILIEVSLVPSIYAGKNSFGATTANIIEFTGDAFFNFIEKAEQYFEKTLKFPTSFKIRIEQLDEKWGEIYGLYITNSVNISKVVKFFDSRVVNAVELYRGKGVDTWFRFKNIDTNSKLLELSKLGDIFKFDKVWCMMDQRYFNKKWNGYYSNLDKEKAMANMPDKITSETLDNLKNLLVDPYLPGIFFTALFVHQSSAAKQYARDVNNKVFQVVEEL